MIAPPRKKWRLETPTLRDLIVLCAQMRPDEIDQYMAMTGATEFDFERAAVGLYQTPGVRFLLVNAAGKTLAAGGFQEVRPQVWRSWLIGTDAAWTDHWRSITEASRFVAECLFEDGAQRIEDYMLAERTDSAKWCVQGLRMRLDGVLPNYASDGRDVAVYSRTIKQIREEAAHGQRQRRAA